MIHVQGLTKRYGDKLALDDVSFDVQAGEILGLLGLNGAGKSTTMNILTGYIGATSGTVTVDGHDISQEPIEAKRAIGYLPEQLAFYGDMRVREYLDFVCDLKGVKTDVASICPPSGTRGDRPYDASPHPESLARVPPTPRLRPGAGGRPESGHPR